MTGSEYQQFLTQFQSQFPETATWLASQPDNTHRVWSEAFRDVDQRSAMRALDAVFRGDASEPRYFSGWPALIRKLARSSTYSAIDPDTRDYGAPRMVDGEWTYECLECRDTGSVICWHPQTMLALSKAMYDGAETDFWKPRPAKYTCAIRCVCNLGSRRYPWMQHVYDPSRWVKCSSVTDEESRSRVVEFIRSKWQSSAF